MDQYSCLHCGRLAIGTWHQELCSKDTDFSCRELKPIANTARRMQGIKTDFNGKATNGL